MFVRMLGACCLGWLSLGLGAGLSVKAADKPSLTIDSVAIVPEIESGNQRKLPWFGCVLVEMRGRLNLPDAPREIDFIPMLQPPLQLPAMDERHLNDSFCLGVGVVDDDGKVTYPCLGRRAEKETFSAKLASGAGLEVRFAGGGNCQLKPLTAETPIALAFYVPAKQPELKLAVQFTLDRATIQAAVPPIAIATKDLGWPIPDKKQKEAKITFAANLPFFIWTEKPTVQANDDYLRFAVNPALSLDEVPDIDNIATRVQMIVAQQGNAGMVNTPFTTTANGQFGLTYSANQFRGGGKATMTITKRSEDPKKADEAPALSNRLNFQINFDPPKAAKTRKERPKKKS